MRRGHRGAAHDGVFILRRTRCRQNTDTGTGDIGLGDRGQGTRTAQAEIGQGIALDRGRCEIHRDFGRGTGGHEIAQGIAVRLQDAVGRQGGPGRAHGDGAGGIVGDHRHDRASALGVIDFFFESATTAWDQRNRARKGASSDTAGGRTGGGIGRVLAHGLCTQDHAHRRATALGRGQVLRIRRWRARSDRAEHARHHEILIVGRRRHGHHPGAVVIDLADGVRNAGAGVAGRGRHDDAGTHRIKEIAIQVRPGRVAAGNRIVDDIDAIGDGVVDRCEQIGAGATGGLTALVGTHGGARRDPGNLGEARGNRRRRYAGRGQGIAGRGTGSMHTMADRLVFGIGAGTLAAAIGDAPIDRAQLFEIGGAEPTTWIIVERGMTQIGTAVDATQHHALAAGSDHTRRHIPHQIGTDKRRTGKGIQMFESGLLHTDHARNRANGIGLGLGQGHRRATQGDLKTMGRSHRTGQPTGDQRQGLRLRLLDLRSQCSRSRAVQVGSRRWLRAGGGLGVAQLRQQAAFGEADDVALGRFGRLRFGALGTEGHARQNADQGDGNS